MSKTIALELASHVPRMCCTTLSPIAVGIAWLGCFVFLVQAAPPSGNAQPGELASKPGAAAAKMDSFTPSVMLLPPRLPAGAAEANREAAEAACDRLSQEITAAGLARVVDRTQIDRILQERHLQADPLRPMLSYDALIRLEADTTRLAPETTLSLIDLSTGNMIARRAFAWPPEEAAAKAMLDFCRDSLKSVTKPAPGKLRVRALWAADAISNERLRPLGQRLIDVFEQSLRRSERVVLVQHLEAATAKEESLLLLMGLGRLPGGRQFTPQADATIELRLVEGDGRGKTFPETPVEIGVRLRKGTGYQGDWVTTAGLVRDFDSLIPQAWQKLSQSLGEVRPEAADAFLNEMALRRKQAEAELKAAKDLVETGVRRDDTRRADSLAAALSHIEAAVKLDPTYPDAVCAHMNALRNVVFEQLRPRGAMNMPGIATRALSEAGRYLDGFRRDSSVCSCLCSSAAFCLECSELNRLYGLTADDIRRPPVTKATLAMATEVVRGLDAVSRLLERGIEDDVEFRYVNADRMMAVAYHGMKLLSVPAAERQAWLERIRRRCREKFRRAAASGNKPGFDGNQEWNEYMQLQVHCAELLLEEGTTDRAKQIIAQTLEEMPGGAQPRGSYANALQVIVEKTGDAELLSDYNRRLGRAEKEQVHLIWLKWPELPQFAKEEGRPPGYFTKLKGWSEPLEIRAPHPPEYRHPSRVRPLAEGGGRLYILISHVRDVIAYIPLDTQGRPVGNAVPNQYGTKIWDSIGEIPQPVLGKNARIASAQCINGKLYLGTSGPFSGAAAAGLLVFDPRTTTWKTFGPEQGLPSSAIERFFPLDDHTLYCTCSAGHYTLNLATGAVTLLHRSNEPAGVLINNTLRLLWRDGERLMAISENGIWTDLLSKVPKHFHLSRHTCYGWESSDMHLGIIGAAEADGRRFFVCRGGLYEVDSAGRVIRSWWTSYYLFPVGSGLEINTGLCINAPPDCPIAGLPALYAAGSRLVLTDRGEATIYDLKTDTWYSGFCCELVTLSGGLWTTTIGNDGLRYLSLEDAVRRAQLMGRAMTTAEYRERKQQFIDAAKPLDRAKFTLGMRQFDNAKAALQEVLDAEPRQPEALILMGFLHDRDCLNQPDEAIKYYRRAAELAGNPVASYSGMYLWVCILKNRGQWKETLDLCEKILQRYPGLEDSEKQRIEWLCSHSRQQLAGKDMKQPTAETSSKEERPAK